MSTAVEAPPKYFPHVSDAQQYIASIKGGDAILDWPVRSQKTRAAADELGIRAQFDAAVALLLPAATVDGTVKRAEKGTKYLDTITDTPPVIALEVGELLTRDFPPMEPLLAPWLRKQNLAMIHAKRGVGKTHLALGIAWAVAGGGRFLKWHAEKPSRVLYIDGEMPGAAMKQRLADLVAATPEGAEPPEGNLRIITPDVQELPLPDLATADGQHAYGPLLGDADLIVVDNLSSLIRSAVENEGEGWLPVAAWALARRREGRAVVFIHHSGKGGAQRGTSRREDLLDVVIRLDHPADYNPEAGAAFRVIFEKSRGIHGEDVREFEASLTTDPHGTQSWTWREADGATLDRVIELHKLGMSQGEIAVELGINKSNVCRGLKKAREGGLLPAEEGRR